MKNSTSVQPENIKGIKCDRTFATVRKWWEKNADSIEDGRIKEIFESLNRQFHQMLRKATKGTHVGNQFYGCSVFPKCRSVNDL